MKKQMKKQMKKKAKILKKVASKIVSKVAPKVASKIASKAGSKPVKKTKNKVLTRSASKKVSLVVPKGKLKQTSVKKQTTPIRSIVNLEDGKSLLNELVRQNLWWTWQQPISEMFEKVDSELWEKTRQNPWEFLKEKKDLEILNQEKNKTTLQSLYEAFQAEMKIKKETKIAYFCMEYGITHLLRNYSGGLGILAGDHLKSASDLNLPLCAFGYAYRYGYFQQKISSKGKQESKKLANDFKKPPFVPIYRNDGSRLVFTIQAPQRKIAIQVWKIAVGRVDLYLLDTDLPENKKEDRKISDQLYSGDSSHRLIQEYVLAIGGYKLIQELNLPIKLFHMNEGHTAMLVLARLDYYMKKEKMSYDKALAKVRESMVFTTHTPIAAGHDVFPQKLATPYLNLFKKTVGVERARNLAASMENTLDHFSMTGLAARCSQSINGVSQIHAEVSQEMFSKMKVSKVRGVTNGVHAPSWISPELQKLISKDLSADWTQKQVQEDFWQKVHNIDDKEIWNVHVEAKKKLLIYLQNHIRTSWAARGEKPELIQKALSQLTEKAFIATFARRFATYKRAHLLFSDPERFAKILSADRPVIFLFAGKAHPADKGGQALIEKIIQYSRKEEFAGKIIFVENYEIDVAKLLVSGSDIWVNNPLRPLEASGTSGMKAAMNGCLNFSVPDGWWAEGYNQKNGWAIGTKDLLGPQEEQDAEDSVTIYDLLEREVLPIFNERGSEALPTRWIQKMKDSIATLIPQFNTDRMLNDYLRMFYKKINSL